MKVFWSWQSDTPGKVGRHFIRHALDMAIEQLKQTPEVEEPIAREVLAELHLDQDRKGISGSPDLARLIFDKIEESTVFVADVTPVGIVVNEGEETKKKLINPNVAIELGYALHALSDRSFLMVMNQHYGTRSDLPFDLRSKAGPILYNLPPDADKPTIASASRSLTLLFVEALKPFIEKRVRIVQRERPFPQAEAKDGPTRYRPRGESLGIRDGAGRTDPGAGNEIFFVPGAAVSLRLMPMRDLGRTWNSDELRQAIRSGINLPTLLGPANGIYLVRAEDGVGTCILQSDNECETDHATFVFGSGEIWAISNFPLKTYSNDIFIYDIEKMFTEALPRYTQFLDALAGSERPYRWIAALSGVKGRELQYPLAPNRMRNPGFGSYKCVSDTITAEGSYNAEQQPIDALLPFFDDIYEKCGMKRPDYLPP